MIEKKIDPINQKRHEIYQNQKMAKILKSTSYQSLGRKIEEIKSVELESTEKLAKKKAIKSDSEIF